MKRLFIIILSLYYISASGQNKSAIIKIEGQTEKRINKYSKTYKIRKKYDTAPLGDVTAYITLNQNVINKKVSDGNGNYSFEFPVKPNSDYRVKFEKKGYIPKIFSFNTNGISNHKIINFKDWDFFLYKRVIGLQDSIFLIPTMFYYDSERGFMTYDEAFNLPLEVNQEETYFNFIKNLNEVDYEIKPINKNESDHKEIIDSTSNFDSLDNQYKTPSIKILNLKDLMDELEISQATDSIIQNKQNEISDEWQQLEIAKTKAITNEDKDKIHEAEKLLIEKEKQIKLANNQIDEARKEIEIHRLENKNKNTLLIFSTSILGLFAILIFILIKNNKERKQSNLLLAEKNREVIDSIKYAQRLQSAILPPISSIKKNLKESFILYQPKDIVSGDFYWIENIDEHITLFAVVDCTGHGVPGAFMSIVAYNALNQALNQHKLIKPAEILNQLNIDITKMLHQSDNIDVEDGMDISLCLLNTKTNELQYAGAYHSLNLLRNGELKIVNGDKFSIGSTRGKNKIYKNHNFKLEKGDYIYTFSDGFADQFGGKKERKFMYKNLRNLLVLNSNKEVDEQSSILLTELNKWKGNLEQVDDICVMGVKIV